MGYKERYAKYYLLCRGVMAVATAIFLVFFFVQFRTLQTKVLASYLLIFFMLLSSITALRLGWLTKIPMFIFFVTDILTIGFLQYAFFSSQIPFSLIYLFPVFSAAVILPVYLGVLPFFMASGIVGYLYLGQEGVLISLVLHELGFILAVGAAINLKRQMDEAERQREESEKWENIYRKTMDYIPSGLLVVDGSGEIKLANPKAKEILKIDPMDGGNEIPCTIGQEILSKVFSLPGARWEGQIHCKHGDVEIGYSVSPFPHGLYVILMRDLRELKQMEEEERRAEILTMLGRMAGDLAHDLRNPLGAIKGAATLLKKRETLTPEKIGELAEVVIEESDHIERLVKDFLLFARPEHREKNFEVVEVSPLVKSLIQRRAKKWKDMGCAFIEVRDRTDQDSPPKVKAVPHHLERAIQNLVDNAVEASPEGEAVHVFIDEDDRSVKITVADRGAGIPPDKIREIFRPLYTTKENGIGLGLSIVQKVVEAHGGNLTVMPRPGGGALFTIRLPKYSEELEKAYEGIGG